MNLQHWQKLLSCVNVDVVIHLRLLFQNIYKMVELGCVLSCGPFRTCCASQSQEVSRSRDMFVFDLRSQWGRARTGRPTSSREPGTPTWLHSSRSMKIPLKVCSHKTRITLRLEINILDLNMNLKCKNKNDF